jgi:hypothetical protein
VPPNVRFPPFLAIFVEVPGHTGAAIMHDSKKILVGEKSGLAHHYRIFQSVAASLLVVTKNSPFSWV